MDHVVRKTVPIGTCLALLLLVTACNNSGSSGGGYAAGSPPGMTPPQNSTAPAQNNTAPGQTPSALMAARPFDLGPMVVDGRGFTLYRYDRDLSTPPRSTCVNKCSEVWTPARSAGDPELTGIDKSLVGKVTRLDGSDQLTLAGWPLYRYTNDQMPGETAGQGLDGSWFPITPDGRKVQTSADTWQADALGI